MKVSIHPQLSDIISTHLFQFSIPLFSAVALFSLVSAVSIPTEIAELEARSGTHLTQAQAQSRLSAAGISSTSTGGCTDRTVSTCTSYDGILSGTVDAMITLKVLLFRSLRRTGC